MVMIVSDGITSSPRAVGVLLIITGGFQKGTFSSVKMKMEEKLSLQFNSNNDDDDDVLNSRNGQSA